MATPESSAHVRRSAMVVAVAAMLFLAVVFLLLLGINMRRGLNHDEHQFVASAALIARDRLLPYRDFPYFHVPTLSLIYALLFRLTGNLLLAARSFSVVCSWLTLVLLFLVALGWLRNLRLGMRFGVGVLTVLLLMTTPSFLHASGRAWNHDLPVLLTMTAACVQGIWLTRGKQSVTWMLATGALIGLAASSRLTFAVVALPFVLSVFLVLSWRARTSWIAALVFGVGALLGALPALSMLWIAPQNFIFGNFTYAWLNTEYYRQAATAGAGMSLVGKAATMLEYVALQPGNLLLALLALFELWRVRASLSVRAAPELIFLLLLAPFFLVGALAPTPIQPQYIYLFFPLFALIFLAALAHDQKPRYGASFVAVAAVVSVVLAGPRYVEGAQIVFDPSEWLPLKVHARGEVLADLVGHRQVLTLAPIYPLEGKAPIYPGLVTGPLGWRVAPLLSADERRQVGLVASQELEAVLATHPPRGVLTGLHDDDIGVEDPLVVYAETHGFVPIALPEEGILWVAPIATWEDAIQLGAAMLPATAVAPGSTLVATLHLQAIQPLAKNLNVLVRLVDATGNELLRSEGWPWGRPTSSWQTGDVWPDGHSLVIPQDAAPGPYRVEVSFYDPETLETLGAPATVGYVMVGDAAPEDAVTPPLAEFGDGIVLADAEVPDAGWRPDATQSVKLTWRAQTPARGRYTAFLHLLAPDGTLVAQRDQEPLQGAYPTDGWLADYPVHDSYALTLPAALPAGDYRLLVGLYDPASQQRLPLLRQGKVAGDAYPLATIHIP